MTRAAKSRDNVGMSRRPREWDTWQGRLVWLIDRAVPHEMTLRELARKAGLPETGLSVQVDRLRAGGNMQFSTVIAMHMVLGCSWDWLADGTGWPSEELRRRMSSSMPPLRSV